MGSLFENRTMTRVVLFIVIALGFGFPSVMVYMNVFHGLDIWFVGFFTFLSLLGAFGLPAMILLIASDVIEGPPDNREIERFREAQIDLLKDLNEMVEYLADIENMLRVEE
ncbi:MAG: hypothetical protein P1Q69_17065 [Candidatus Thorarchaeota archaeon]|nr:hypothetical protein [Candidatus Thorarchaeota archaeon]